MKKQNKKSNILSQSVGRREFIGTTAKLGLAASTLGFPNISLGQTKPPNVLMIPIDDLNDWVGILGGYPLVQTPNIDRLAALGRNYTNAHANVPACSPSRTSTLFGMHPVTHGTYTNDEEWQRNSFLESYTSLPKFFKDNGYYTTGTGKLFHSFKPDDEISGTQPAAWDDWQFCKEAGCNITVVADHDRPEDASGRKIALSEYVVGRGGDFDFGPYYNLAQVPDTLRANWLAQSVLSQTRTKPFFAVCGIAKPHLPFIVPQQFFNLYADGDITYPLGASDPTHHTYATNTDMQDVGTNGRRMNAWLSDHTRLIETGEWKAVIKAYLASISYADYCVGILLDALEAGPNRDNTIVVLWSDHGWQLGEKLAWRKFTLWERALRIPFIMAGPGIPVGTESQPISLMDLYPTMTDLTLNTVPAHLQGTSLKNNLKSSTRTHRHSLSTWMEGPAKPNGGPHFSVRTEHFRLIQLQNGERELYDHRTDRYELTNLLNTRNGIQPSAANLQIAQTLKSFLPTGTFAPRRGGLA